MTAFEEAQLRRELARLHQEIAQRDLEIEALNAEVTRLELACESLVDFILPPSRPSPPRHERAEPTAEYGPIMKIR